uniref:Uncharacterized protein n=1 Tax=Setaria digitata TaxID=48799 RepID=A0A915PLP1_9BILA
MEYGLLENPFANLVDPTISCFVYRKINGTIREWDYDDCITGNSCCFSALTIDSTGENVVEVGGCQNDFKLFLLQSPGIHVHPLDRLPFLGQFSDEKITEYCEFEKCLASTIPSSHWRICACHAERCNDGIDKMLKNFMTVKPMETSTLPLNVFDRYLEFVLNG